jgi:hypothetical protein
MQALHFLNIFIHTHTMKLILKKSSFLFENFLCSCCKESALSYICFASVNTIHNVRICSLEKRSQSFWPNLHELDGAFQNADICYCGSSNFSLMYTLLYFLSVQHWTGNWNVSAILYAVVLHGTVDMGYLSQNLRQHFFLCHILCKIITYKHFCSREYTSQARWDSVSSTLIRDS